MFPTNFIQKYVEQREISFLKVGYSKYDITSWCFRQSVGLLFCSKMLGIRNTTDVSKTLKTLIWERVKTPSSLAYHKHLLYTTSFGLNGRTRRTYFSFRYGYCGVGFTVWTRTRLLQRRYHPVVGLPITLILEEKCFHEDLLCHRRKPQFWKLWRRNIIFEKIFILIIISWPNNSTLETPGVEPVYADKQIE